MERWTSGDVDAGGVRIHYTRTGGGKPPVLLAHGVTDAGLCWTPLAEALAPAYDLVMVDARGHGRSEAPEGGYGPLEQAGDLAAVIAGLGLRRPAIIGHSMGAATTMALAGTRPELPGAIVLEDPPPWWTVGDGSPRVDQAERSSHADRERMRAWIAGYAGKTAAELIAAKRREVPTWSEAELEPWAAAKLQVSPHVARIFDSESRAGVDWQALLPRIACPALLITGDPALGALVTDADAEALRALIPRLDVVRLPRAGHNVRREQVDPYLAAVRGFLAGWNAEQA